MVKELGGTGGARVLILPSELQSRALSSPRCEARRDELKMETVRDGRDTSRKEEKREEPPLIATASLHNANSQRLLPPPQAGVENNLPKILTGG